MTDAQPPVHAATERLRRWNRAFNPIVVVAAILPLGPIIAGDDPTDGPGAVLSLGCWLVFAVDFVAHLKLSDQFLRTWRGRGYLTLVVVTFPVYLLIPGLEEADLLAVTRLGWVVILAMASIKSVRDVRLLVNRVGAAGLYAGAAVFVAAIVVTRVEEPDDGFDSFGDGVWWAIGTITTVGYGDRVPTTTSGRFVATLLMVSGLAFLGVVAASLAAFFGVGDSMSGRDPSDASEAPYEELLAEIRALHAKVDRLAAGSGEAPDQL